MKQKETPLVDEHLLSFRNMKEATTDPFFYTRLKVKMERRQGQSGWNFPLKPVWVIGSLALLLALNGIMLVRQLKTSKTETSATGSSLQSFAASYDQSISSSY